MNRPELPELTGQKFRNLHSLVVVLEGALVGRLGTLECVDAAAVAAVLVYLGCRRVARGRPSGWRVQQYGLAACAIAAVCAEVWRSGGTLGVAVGVAGVMAGLAVMDIERRSRTRRALWPVAILAILASLSVYSLSGIELASDADLLTALEHEPSIRHRRVLRLRGPGFTDLALASLAQIPNVHHLDLRDSRITGDGLRHLTSLSRLRVLNLSGTGVTDDAIPHLLNLRGLQDLRLDGTLVTESSVDALVALPLLGYVSIRDTSLTPSDVGALKERLRMKGVTLELTTDYD